MEKYNSNPKNLPSFNSRLSSLSSYQPSTPSKEYLLKTDRLQTESNPVRLGDYVHKRKFSKEKKISEHVKSLQLVTEDDTKTKQLKFQRENLIRMCDRICSEISKKKTEINEMSQGEVKHQQKWLEKVLDVVLVKKAASDEKQKCQSTTETSISSNRFSNLSSKYLDMTPSDNKILLLQQTQKQKNKLTEQIGQNKPHKRQQTEKQKQESTDTYLKRLRQKYQKETDIPRKNEALHKPYKNISEPRISSSSQNNNDLNEQNEEEYLNGTVCKNSVVSLKRLKSLLSEKYEKRERKF